jgi:BASS family bile acid:Na+ symporter
MLSLIAAVGTPLLVELLFPALEAGRPPIVWLILLLVMLVVAPLLAGRVVQMLAPDAALKMSRFLGALSIVIFIVVVLLTSKYKTPAMKSLGGPGIAAIILLTIGSWLAGWLLGGPGANNRKVVAISASMRNVGVCMALATHYFSDPSVAVPLLAFSGVSIPMNMLFAFMVGHAFRHNQTGRAEKAESAGEPGSNPVQVAR